ncbi:MAG: hypothetical protein ABI983_04450 [Acidobacteriota bacterium]
MVGLENGTQISWWQWPTVLSLDAPIVVIAWQILLASVADVRLGWPHVFVLATSIWLSYSADRWIEGWRLAPGAIRTARHAFYQRRRWLLFPMWIAALAADLGVALTRLSRQELMSGWLVVPPVLAYLLSHQLIHRHHPLRVPKEVCVALLLGAGAAVFPIARAGIGHQDLWLALALFVALAFANCALISVWEAEVDRSHGQTSLALQFGGHGWIHRVPWLLAGLAAFLGVLGGENLRITAVCAVGSAILLGFVDVLHVRLGWRVSRVLADAALLTPLLAMVFGL